MVRRCQEAGLVNDEAWALSRARRLLARGHPPRRIRQLLSAAGVSQATAGQAVDSLVADNPDPQLQAMLSYARRRHLGPYRPAHQREERRKRDLGALLRAGFPFALATRLLDAPDVQRAEALLEGGWEGY